MIHDFDYKGKDKVEFERICERLAKHILRHGDFKCQKCKKGMRLNLYPVTVIRKTNKGKTIDKQIHVCYRCKREMKDE